MPSPILPEECLWLIVDCLKDDRATLHALLCSSTVLFRIAVHYLYRSPFRILDQERNWHWTVVERTRRWDTLLHLLLHSSRLLLISPGDSRYSDQDVRGNDNTLLPRYGPEVQTLPSPSTVDYLSYCTDMFHEPMLHETFMTLFPTIPNCYHANVIWYRSMVELRCRIELAMFERVAPQLVSLTIAMGIQVPRIKIPWLSNLRRLEVAGTDICLLTERNINAGADGHTTRILDDMAGINTRSLEDFAMTRLDQMLAFIWDHQRIFGTLRELKIEIKGVQFQNQPSHQLIELVEAMGDTLEVLDVQFWPEAVLYLDRIPTRNLKSLLLHQMKDPEPFLEQSRTMAVFLRQCPKLDTIKMYTKEKDLLESWRSRMGRKDDSLGMMLPGLRTLSLDSRSEGRRSKLMNISIAGLAQDVIAIVNEAVDMFASELKSISVRSWFNGRLMTTPLSWSNSATSLQHLTDLNLEGEVSWTFDYSSLSKCPRLNRIRLAFTGPMPSRSAKKQPAIGLLAKVSTLRDLELVGHWETLDNKGWPAVVARIARLERLDLKGCEGMTADQVLRLQLAIEENGRTNDKEGHTECTLRWIIVNKRLEDALARLGHNYWRQQMPSGAQKQVHHSFVATARPSH